MPIGPILLTILIVAIVFGLAERVLERMRVSPRTALVITSSMLLGSLIDIPLGPRVSVNVGGGLIPIAFCTWLIATADEVVERVRAVGAAAVTAMGVAVLARWLPAGEPTELNLFYLEASYFYALLAGVLGYTAGRSRRSAFCAGVLGVLFGDIAHVVLSRYGAAQIGGGGLLDTGVVAGVLAVFLAELIGESREAFARQREGSAGDG